MKAMMVCTLTVALCGLFRSGLGYDMVSPHQNSSDRPIVLIVGGAGGGTGGATGSGSIGGMAGSNSTPGPGIGGPSAGSGSAGPRSGVDIDRPGSGSSGIGHPGSAENMDSARKQGSLKGGGSNAAGSQMTGRSSQEPIVGTEQKSVSGDLDRMEGRPSSSTRR